MKSMASLALELFEELTASGEDQKRARIFARAFDRLETTINEAGRNDLQVARDIEDTKLKAIAMNKELEQVRLQVKESEVRLAREIAAVHQGMAAVQHETAGVQQAIAGVHQGMAAVHHETAGVQQAIAGVHQNMAAVQREVAGVHQNMAGVQHEVAGVQQNIAGVQHEVSGVHREIAEVHREIAGVHKEIAGVHKAITRHTWAILGGFGILGALLKLSAYFGF